MNTTINLSVHDILSEAIDHARDLGFISVEIFDALYGMATQFESPAIHLGDDLESLPLATLEEWKKAVIEDGKKEGFPDCCAAFFVEIWVPLCEATGACDEAQSVMNRYAARAESVGAGNGYIPCPDCLTRLEKERPAAGLMKEHKE